MQPFFRTLPVATPLITNDLGNKSKAKTESMECIPADFPPDEYLLGKTITGDRPVDVTSEPGGYHVTSILETLNHSFSTK